MYTLVFSCSINYTAFPFVILVFPCSINYIAFPFVISSMAYHVLKMHLQTHPNAPPWLSNVLLKIKSLNRLQLFKWVWDINGTRLSPTASFFPLWWLIKISFPHSLVVLFIVWGFTSAQNPLPGHSTQYQPSVSFEPTPRYFHWNFIFSYLLWEVLRVILFFKNILVVLIHAYEI